MPIICPTVTAFDNHDYREQMERVEPFAQRVHIDLMDGEFAPSVSPDLEHVWWPENITADIHLMYQRPAEQMDWLKKLKPSLVIIHAEADCDFTSFAAELHQSGIKAGLAILQDTSLEIAGPLLQYFDHVLVFSGKLGFHGGQADLGLLERVQTIREHHPSIEIAWDGGVNDQNARQLAEGGIDVLNAGGYVQKSENPASAYDKLKAVIEG